MGNRIGPYPITRRADGTASVGPFDFVSDNEWNDFNFSVGTARIPAINNPALTSLTTNISQYTFAVNDYVDLASIEILHQWAEGTALHPHLHVISNGEELVDTKVQWTLYYTWVNVDGEVTEDSISVEHVIPANTNTLTHLLVPFNTTIDGTGKRIGSLFCARIKRVAKTAGGNNPAANPWLINVGLHAEMDSIGSLQISSKY